MSFLLTPFTATRDFMGRHKRKILGGTAVAVGVGGYMAYRKYWPMIQEFRAQLEMIRNLEEQTQSDDSARHAALQQQLANNLRVGDLTLRNFSHKIRQQLQARFPVQDLRKQMSKGKKKSEKDYALWEKFKIWGFSRTIASLYALVLTNTMIKVQVNLFSRYVMVEDKQIASVNERYLGFAEHFQTIGLDVLCDDVEAAVTEVMKSYPLSSRINHDTLTKIITDVLAKLQETFFHIDSLLPPAQLVTKQINDFVSTIALAPPSPSPNHSLALASPSQDPTTALTATPNANDHNAPFSPGPGEGEAKQATDPRQEAEERLTRMLDETRVLFQSDAFKQLFESILDATTPTLTHHLQLAWADRASKVATPSQLANPVPMANVIIRATKAFSTLLPSSEQMAASPLFTALSSTDDIQEFCSIIFLPMSDTLAPTPPPTPAPAQPDDMMGDMMQLLQASDLSHQPQIEDLSHQPQSPQIEHIPDTQ